MDATETGQKVAKNVNVRVTPALRKAMVALAQKERRRLSDWVRLTLEDAVKAKAK